MHLYSSLILACNFLFFSFFVISLSGSDFREMLALENEYGSISSSAVFGRIKLDDLAKHLVQYPAKSICWVNYFFLCVVIIFSADVPLKSNGLIY